MSKVEHIRCDNEDCGGGSKHFWKCGNNHDICGCCLIELEGGPHCPICLKNARLK